MKIHEILLKTFGGGGALGRKNGSSDVRKSSLLRHSELVSRSANQLDRSRVGHGMTNCLFCETGLPSCHLALRSAFTLAEVLITLGIIGVAAAITMPSLITNIQNMGYAEKLKKSYSLISQTTKLVSEDMGTEPKYWAYSHYTDGDEHDSLNRNILDAYKKHLQVVKEYTTHYNEYGYSEENKALSYRYLNGEANAVNFYSRGEIFCVTYVFKLADGTTMGLTFSNNKGGGVLWGLIEKGIRIAFIVDVNGPAKPNQIGRDIFWFALYNDGKILPYDINDTSECTKDGKGYSCAARIINEGKMNY